MPLPPDLPPEDVQATFAATLVDEWARCGVEDAVIAPGSRSTPFALALAAHEDIRVHVHIDERSAGFLALGIAMETWQPTIVLTTSGTAAAELHPAVIEADLSGVPLLVCTADRPPELRDVGAPQAIDQTHLYGRSVRWFHDPGVADRVVSPRWRALGSRAYAAAVTRPGPVHLNLPFREPLLGTVAELPPPNPREPHGVTWQPPYQPPGDPVITPLELSGRRGIVIAGGALPPGRLLAAAEALGWPVLPDARVRGNLDGPHVVAHADGILRSEHAGDALRPDVVLRLGDPPASRVLAEWVASTEAEEIVVAGRGRWADPSGTASVALDLDPGDLLAAWAPLLDQATAADPSWLAAWRSADDAAAGAIVETLAGPPMVREPAVAREVLAALPDAARLVVSSSMPIRDVEWYAAPRTGVCVHANRGANGIDGVVSTAVGVAVGSGAPTVLLIGDLAFLHDVNGLLGAEQRGIDLTIVVIDNEGGGIFSFLPQAAAVPELEFDELFGTPHDVDLVAIAITHGASAWFTEEPASELAEALAEGGVNVLVALSDREGNLDIHRELSDAIVAGVDAVLPGTS